MNVLWLILDDGRTVVGGCGSTTLEWLELALAEPDRMLALTSDDRVDVLPISSVRDFAFVDARSIVPEASSIYRLVHV